MSFDAGLLVQYAPTLLSGLLNTIWIWLAGSAIALIVGCILGIALTFGPRRLRILVRCYVEFFRGTPLLAQLFLLYYGGPGFGVTLSAVSAGLIGLGLYGGAYFTELFRAGFASVPAGQVEAAKSFGYSARDTLRHVILPQALILMVPPSVNLLVILLKDTSILSIITIPELTFQVTGMTLETFAFVEPYLVLEPFVVLFDEPTSSLDPELVGEVLQVIRSLAAEGMTMVVVTHEMGFAAQVASRIVFIDEGIIVEEGPPREVFGAPRSERLRRFLQTWIERNSLFPATAPNETVTR